MKKGHTIIIAGLLLTFVGLLSGANNLECQSLGQSSTRTLRVPRGDSVSFNLDYRFGQSQWHYSVNGTTWAPMNQTGRILEYKAEAPLFIKASVANGNCKEQFSDVVHIVPCNPPSISNLSIKNITSSSFELRGRVTFSGEDTVTDRGITYIRWNQINLETRSLSIGPGDAWFNSKVGGLMPNETYLVGVYGTNCFGTINVFADTIVTFLDTTNFLIGQYPDNSMVRIQLAPVVLSPDAHETETYDLSLYSDGKIDFSFSASNGSSPGGFTYHVSSMYVRNRALEVVETTSHYMVRFVSGDRLSSSNIWSKTSAGINTSFSFSNHPNWNQMKGYVVFRTKSGASYKYGWIKIGIEDQSIVRIYEYAIMR